MDAKFRTYYMDEAVFSLAEVIETAKKRLAGVDCDTLVGTGFSGAIVIPSLALAMGKKFVLVRKDNDDSHHGKGRLVGEVGSKWVFVDDFVASGQTRSRVIEKVERWSQDHDCVTKYVGQYTYQSYNDDDGRGRFEPAGSDTLGYLY